MRAAERQVQSPAAVFIGKWRDSKLSERAGAQSFFLDLCDLLEIEKPSDPENYCFERGAIKTGAGKGWADVWKRNCFAWENKKPGQDLGAALKQLMTYALALDNPPLLVVCDRQIIEIHTHFTGTPSEFHTIRIEDIGQPENLQKLRWLFSEPERFRPRRTVDEITADAAGRFAELARDIAARNHDPREVAHFLIQCLFCMFAEDAGLLSEKPFQLVVEKCATKPKRLTAELAKLFSAMRTGGDFLLEEVPWFNGGLFETVDPIPMTGREIEVLLEAARMDWSQIEPSIFGTLFERGLDPALRAQLGANYTDPETIRKIIDPVVVAPLLEEWAAIKSEISTSIEAAKAKLRSAEAEVAARLARSIRTSATGPARYKELQQELAKKVEVRKGLVTKAERQGKEAFLAFIYRLREFRVLDAACGSGNFLYLALRALKDLEHRANLEAEALGLHRQLIIETSPANVLGIEINPYAAELARVTIWIGEIQWMLRHGYQVRRDPILAKLDHIECWDAVLEADGTEPSWPSADVIVGNPPFIGDKKMRRVLGNERVVALRRLYEGRVPGGADYVTYWFEKARAQIVSGKARRAGLVGTSTIRGGASRSILDRICASTRIFEAWSDEAWVNEGAAVQVSLVCFGDRNTARLNGKEAASISADLTAMGSGGSIVDLTTAKPLPENAGSCLQGITKGGRFDVPGTLARSWLASPNPNGKSNAEVVRPWRNGLDITRRGCDNWIIDFANLTQDQAALYERPFAYVLEHVKPDRDRNAEKGTRERYWRFKRSAADMKRAIRFLPRFIVTPEVSKHRVFVWLRLPVVPDKNLVVIARADDVTFGVLSSRFHEVWSLRLGTSLEDRPRYTSTTTFETFPFPPGLNPRESQQEKPDGIAARSIAAAARRLNEFREKWLNPPMWTDRVSEGVPGFPDRIVAKAGHERDLAARTLTALYNQRPAWLDRAHEQLDAAVATAYGWTDYSSGMPDEEILTRLLALNQQRSRAPARKEIRDRPKLRRHEN
jgi:hypothetical protein